MSLLKFGNIKSANVIGFLLIWCGICIIAVPTTYVLMIFIANPPQDFLFQSYRATIVLEVLAAVVISFLNVQNKSLKIKNNISGKPEAQENRPLKENNLLTYFTRSFFLILGILGLFDFGYLTYLSPSGQKVIPSVMIQSTVFGGMISLIFTIIRFQRLRRKK